MKKQPKTVMTYQVSVVPGATYGWSTVKLHLSGARAESIAERIEGTVDNKAGYGNRSEPSDGLRIARGVGERFRNLQERGYEHVYDTMHGRSAGIEWSSCIPKGNTSASGDKRVFGQPRMSDALDLSQIQPTLNLLKPLARELDKRTGRAWASGLWYFAFTDPQPVLDLLASLPRKWLRIELVRPFDDQRSIGEYVAAREPLGPLFPQDQVAEAAK